MKISKIKLCAMLFFIVLIFYHNANAMEMVKGEIVSNNIVNEKELNNNKNNLSRNYNLTFINNSKYDMLNIKRTDEKCMYKTGSSDINLMASERINQEIEDKNTFGVPFCFGLDKYISWTAETYIDGEKYQSCDIQFYVDFIPSPWITGSMSDWYTRVDTSSCKLKVTATCDGVDCLNIEYGVSNPPSDVVITIKDDNTLSPPTINSPQPDSTVENNYITILGTGVMKDGFLPLIITDFNPYNYATQFTGDDKNWISHLWISCGITGTISIKGIKNSDVTLNGPPCGATITSIQDGQIIPTGKYSLSGRMNSDTADNAKHMQVQITGYQMDGTIYVPTTSYIPNVDTGTGKWELGGLEAVCGINYNVSVSINTFSTSSGNYPTLPNLIGSNISYHTANCPIEITKPENYEVVSSTINDVQNILIEGKATDGTRIDGSINSLNSQDYSNGFAISVINNNRWSTEIQDVPIGFMKITVTNYGTEEVPIETNSDEVTILSSKIFSVEAKKDNVFTGFYGTSMPYVEDEDFSPEVEISSDNLGFFERNITDEKGDWKAKNKHYAKRGVYLFTFQEYNDSENYAARDKKKIKCTGGDSGMSCINQ
ncbi:hypothetical protein [Xenorhabdus japonica]|uniref:Uncharacterized protein n=1 Tax=Xenorhabdus japonica TaxID=53341 RepID=A0A1I4ZXC6_9GAMM|nr:hypothetical protein [Xenorhabdus japonica]SFN54845.1 hypothetical protein SAMN05421579_10844 [Xenorhabdus japonica]